MLTTGHSVIASNGEMIESRLITCERFDEYARMMKRVRLKIARLIRARRQAGQAVVRMATDWNNMSRYYYFPIQNQPGRFWTVVLIDD